MGPVLGAAHVASVFVAAISGQGSQEPPTSASPPGEHVQKSAPNPSMLRVPAATIIDIEIMEPLSSKTAKMDATFPIRVYSPVVVDGRELIPAGTPGTGQVIHAAKSGGGGKAGELLLAARYLDINGARVPLRRFRMGASGAQKADEAFAVGFVVPFGQLLVKGKEIEFQVGTRAHAVVAVDTDIPVQSPDAGNAVPSNPQPGE